MVEALALEASLASTAAEGTSLQGAAFQMHCLGVALGSPWHQGQNMELVGLFSVITL